MVPFMNIEKHKNIMQWIKDMKGWIVPDELKDELTGESKTYITDIIENTDEYLEKKTLTNTYM